MAPPTTLTPAATEELTALLGPRFVTSPSARRQHGTDESPLEEAAPEGVAYPGSVEEVSATVRVCARHGVPIIPFGAGTSLEGHVLATSGGVSLDLTRMDSILAVRPDDMDATVQAGVTRTALNARLARDGLFFPVDPGADATIGGMTATGASGTTTVKYGAMRENVLGVRVVLADGRVVDTASRARKSSAGYDLTRLFIGSEGTLGVITEVTVRLYGVPEAISSATCRFPEVTNAVDAVTTIMQMGVDVARIEFLDELSIEAINAFSKSTHPVAPTLFFEFHGSTEAVAEQAKDAGDVLAGFGAIEYRAASRAEGVQLWRARHDHFYASRALRPGSRAITTDVCVPLSRLAGCIDAARADVLAFSLTATIAGHVGDGNFHVVVLVDPDDEDEMRRAEEMNHRLVERALDMDGTCTGEHGIGLRKVSFLELELPEGVEIMRSIKRALDPQNLMNPGKVVTI